MKPALFMIVLAALVSTRTVSSSDTMFGAVLSSFGEPGNVVSFSTTLPKPVPLESQVLVKIEASPMHPSDFLFIRGLYRPDMDSFPQVPGAEGTGVIEAVGEGVTGFKVGDRVCFWHSYTGGPGSGSWAEYAAVGQEHLVRVPEGLGAAEASQLVLNPLTMIGIMEQFGDVQPGEWVIQNAANSACGKFLVQYLKMKGIKTINVVRHAASGEILKELGADVVVAEDAGDDLTAAVQAATGGQGVKYAIDCVWGGGAAPALIDTLAPGGKMVNFGVLAGPAAEVNVVPLLFGMRSVQGFNINAWRAGADEEAVAGHLAQVSAWLKDGSISLPAESFGLESTAHAMAHAEGPKKAHKTLLVPGRSHDEL
ncbi:unnamed protein product [Heterosigma akashiwo]